MVPASEIKRKESLLKKIGSKFKHGLVLQTIRNQLSRIGIKITPYYWVQEGLNITDAPGIKGNISEYTVEFIGAEEIKRIANDVHAYSEKGMLKLLEKGNKCLALRHQEEIASLMYIDFDECDFASLDLALKDDEAYLTYMYTMDAFRGKNLAPYLRYRSYEILRKMGRDKIYSVSVLFNSSAIRYKEKLNAKNLKLILYLELFKKIKWSITLRTY